MQRSKTTAQNSRLFGLLNRLGIDKTGRAQLVYDYTNGRSSSSADLYYNEADALIKALEGQAGETPTKPDQATKMRKRIISIAHEMGWELPGGAADMDHIYEWTLKYGYLHKPLNDYTAAELPRLITQFDGVYRHYLNSLK